MNNKVYIVIGYLPALTKAEQEYMSIECVMSTKQKAKQYLRDIYKKMKSQTPSKSIRLLLGGDALEAAWNGYYFIEVYKVDEIIKIHKTE